MTNDTTPLPETDDPFKVYIAGLRRALGSREPLEVLREMPAELRRAVAGLSPAQLATPEALGKWSVAQVVQHLADSDLVVGFRIRMVLAHERPELAAYDQDLWADHLGYADADIETALEDFTRLRHANLRLLERASDEDRRRVGLHTERGPESIEDMLPNVAGHDMVHLRQIARIRQALGAPTAP